MSRQNFFVAELPKPQLDHVNYNDGVAGSVTFTIVDGGITKQAMGGPSYCGMGLIATPAMPIVWTEVETVTKPGIGGAHRVIY